MGWRLWLVLCPVLLLGACHLIIPYESRQGSISDCDKDSTADKIAWYKHNSGGKVQVVGYKKLPNKWGLYDMAGNVYEWVNDYYQSGLGTSSIQDPGGGTIADKYRVLRGGSFHQESNRTRAAWRQGELPGGGALNANGVRCVRTKP